jgi:Xaa-Pro aminopeptidase
VREVILKRLDNTFLVVFFSYAVVTVDQVTLFVPEGQLTEDVLQYLGDQVKIKSYNSFFDDLKELPSTLDLDDKSVSDSHESQHDISQT